MLDLMHGAVRLGTYQIGSWFTLPTGEMVSPAHEGWTNGEYELVAHVPDPEPVPPPEPVDLLAYAADARWQREVGGVQFGLHRIATDDRSKLLILGARSKAVTDPDFTTDFKMEDGTFVTLDADTLIAMGDAVLEHVAQGFAIEASVVAQIDAETITTPEQIDTAFAV